MANGTTFIQLPKKSPEPKIGNILLGREYLSELLDESVVETMRCHNLALAGSDRGNWYALKKMGIACKALQDAVTYNCPVREGAQFYYIYPIYISRMNPDEAAPHLRMMVEEDPKIDGLLQPPTIGIMDDLFLGHGYTCGSMINNGHSRKRWAKIELSDDRYLLAAYFEWYNK